MRKPARPAPRPGEARNCQVVTSQRHQKIPFVPGTLLSLRQAPIQAREILITDIALRNWRTGYNNPDWSPEWKYWMITYTP